jgi:hypothetical protein
MSDLFDERDERDTTERETREEGASLIGGGGPPSTLNDDAEMNEADFHGDRLAGGDPVDRPGDDD